MTFDTSNLSDRQKLALVEMYAAKYSGINARGHVIPPPEFGDSFRDFDIAVGVHYSQTRTSVKRLRDLLIARFPGIPQPGFRNPKDPDAGRRPFPLGAPVTVVYTAAKRLTRGEFHNIVAPLLPRPYSRRVAGTGHGYAADDTNRKPRQKPNNVKGKKKTSGRVTKGTKRNTLTCSQDVECLVEFLMGGGPAFRVTMSPNTRVTRCGGEITFESLTPGGATPRTLPCPRNVECQILVEGSPLRVALGPDARATREGDTITFESIPMVEQMA